MEDPGDGTDGLAVLDLIESLDVPMLTKKRKAPEEQEGKFNANKHEQNVMMEYWTKIAISFIHMNHLNLIDIWFSIGVIN